MTIEPDAAITSGHATLEVPTKQRPAIAETRPVRSPGTSVETRPVELPGVRHDRHHVAVHFAAYGASGHTTYAASISARFLAARSVA